MLFLLSPAKTLDYETPPTTDTATRPQFVEQSAQLIDLLRPKSAAQIALLMDLSPALAELNVERYAAWSPRFTARNSKQAVLAFDGDVYGGLDAPSLSEADLAWAQKHVAILSGLYGLLRPLDRMQPYRLEMGTALRNPRGKDLYAYWAGVITPHLNRRLAGEKERIVVNLASQEYFGAVRRRDLRARVIDCVFEEGKPEGYKVISFFAKRARGLMVRHAIQQRVQTPEGLRDFALDGYRLDESASEADRLVFRRRVE
ncbi:MAG: peroxide stress protein YaaA [Rhizobacter sp.]|nr:peroxide stress protein YaaA [Rhizobacter sp.]